MTLAVVEEEKKLWSKVEILRRERESASTSDGTEGRRENWCLKFLSSFAFAIFLFYQ